MKKMPINSHQIKEFLLQGAQVALLIRHAERFEINESTPNWGSEVLLTPVGITSAQNLGASLLGDYEVQFFSSPVKRCVQTAQNIQKGMRLDAKPVQPLPLLGDPGLDFRESFEDGYVMGSEQIRFMEWLVETGQVKEFVSIKERCKEILDLVRQKQGKEFSLFVAHDLQIASMLKYTGVKNTSRADWCGFMEGVVLVTQSGEENFYWFKP
jgi:broad specificity phosphatase PhoE